MSEISVSRLDGLIHPGFSQIGNNRREQPDAYQGLFQCWDSRVSWLAKQKGACLLYFSCLTQSQIDKPPERGSIFFNTGVMEEILRLDRYKMLLGERFICLADADDHLYPASDLAGVLQKQGWRTSDQTRLEVYGEVRELCVTSLGNWIKRSLAIDNNRFRINGSLSLSEAQICWYNNSYQLLAESPLIHTAQVMGRLSMRAVRFIGHC